MTRTTIKRYSEAFKKQVVSEYERGTTLNQLKHKYGITGATTVSQWVAKYGRQGLRHQLMIIQHPDERQQLKQLQEENGRLKEVIAQQSLDLFMTKSCLAVAEQELGYEVQEKKSTKWPSKPVSKEPSNHNRAQSKSGK